MKKTPTKTSHTTCRQHQRIERAFRFSLHQHTKTLSPARLRSEDITGLGIYKNIVNLAVIVKTGWPSWAVVSPVLHTRRVLGSNPSQEGKCTWTGTDGLETLTWFLIIERPGFKSLICRIKDHSLLVFSVKYIILDPAFNTGEEKNTEIHNSELQGRLERPTM